jgi:hypothetical protein
MPSIKLATENPLLWLMAQPEAMPAQMEDQGLRRS